MLWDPGLAPERKTLRYTRESAWREDNRRVSNGDETQHAVRLALSSGPSVDFCGYWQRHKAV
jgi:hypothetical protein